MRFLSLALTSCVIAGLSFISPAKAAWYETADATASVINNQGEEIGTAYVKKASDGILLYVDVKGLTPGWHGMHFHEKGTCEDHDAFKMAGGHVMEPNAPHGFLHPEGPHDGNLPNLIVAADGTAQVEIYSDIIDYMDDDADDVSLMDEDGSALIIHENIDDHYTQPIGGAGGRVACGVVKAVQQ